MNRWRSQHFRHQSPPDISGEVLNNAVKTAELTEQANQLVPPIFSLGHLAYYTGVQYGVLRSIVARADVPTYRNFVIHKRPVVEGRARYRKISVPSAPLMLVQRWINAHILQKAKPDAASTAFASGCDIRSGAEIHCGSRWLIKIDVQDFFSSINEISVYRVFRTLGYQPLISFELARLCTQLGRKPDRPCWENYRPPPSPHPWPRSRATVIGSYWNRRIGYLPQGAPTSPMLANMVMKVHDKKLRDLADNWGFVYSRYADDMTFSTRHESCREICKFIVSDCYRVLKSIGLSPNLAKTHVVPPGARKIVLGLNVDGDEPRLPRDFRLRMRQHLHYVEKAGGPVQHATMRGFRSVSGLRHHLAGLAAFASQIEPEYGASLRDRLAAIDWPA